MSSLKIAAILLVAIIPIVLGDSTTIITSWIPSNGSTGYGGYTANVKNVY